MRGMLFPLTALSAVFLLILQGCGSVGQPRDQPPTEAAPRESAKAGSLDHPKGTKPRASEDDVIQAILAAENPSEAKDGYSALFTLVGNDGLTRLRAHNSDTIAIQAAWMQVELTVPVEPPPQTVRPDREKLTWFLGFLEGRARVTPPKWWADAILDARANRRGNVYAGGLADWVDRKEGDPIFKTWPAKAAIERQEDKLVVRLGNESADLPGDFLKNVKKQQFYDEARALFTPTRCYVAIHESVGYSYRLGCVERTPSRTRWVSDVWGSWWCASTGVSRQWIEIVKQGDRVVVFGIGAGFHVEAFRADDGANLFRFSNSYTP